MAAVVLKFGGTSVESAEAMLRLARIAADRRQERPVIVVSAMAGVTDRLVELTHLALANRIDDADRLIAQLRRRHLEALAALAAEPAPAGAGDNWIEPTESALRQFCTDLAQLARGIAALGELTDRTRDAVLSFGERMSPWLVRVALERSGLNATLVDARQLVITDEQFTQAQPLFAECQPQANARLRPALEAGLVPVLGGFIGATRAGVPTTLGRGGSDFSAAIVGALLQADRIEIWTDVDGMLTTDPRACPAARRIKVMSFQEAAESAYFGAKVLHPATLVPAMALGIPVWVLNSRAWLPGRPDGEKTGTLITTRAPRSETVIKCISSKRRIVVIDIVSTRMLNATGFLKAIWEVFARHRCPVDMVTTSEVSVSLTISETPALPEIVDELGHFADVRYEGRKAIVCLVGDGLRNHKGVAAQIFAAMGDINLRMISQGASEINVGMVIDDERVPEALARLHARFFADPDPTLFA